MSLRDFGRKPTVTHKKLLCECIFLLTGVMIGSMSFYSCSFFCFTEIALELTGSLVPYAGRVKVRYQGVWGTFCSDEWQHEIAEVICRQLGFDGVELDLTLNNLDEYSRPKIYDVGPGPVWFRSSGCKGHEKNLSECDLTEDRYCLDDNVELICKMENVSVNGKRFQFVRMCCNVKERLIGGVVRVD